MTSAEMAKSKRCQSMKSFSVIFDKWWHLIVVVTVIVIIWHWSLVAGEGTSRGTDLYTFDCWKVFEVFWRPQNLGNPVALKGVKSTRYI